MGTPKKATVDFQLADNGQTATATITPVDAVGEPTTLPAGTAPPSWTSSNPIITVTPSADGLSAALALALPTPPPNPLPTGISITATATVASGTITGSGLVDIVPGPAGSLQMSIQ